LNPLITEIRSITQLHKTGNIINFIFSRKPRSYICSTKWNHAL